jgi:hypothetical protein
MTLLGQLVHLHSPQQLQLVLCEVQGLAGLGVGEAGPALGDLDGVEQGIESLASGGAHDLLAVDVVADVGVRVVERERDVANCVFGLLGVRVVRVVDGVDLGVFVAHVAVGVGDDAVVGLFLLLVTGSGCRPALREVAALAVGGHLVAQNALIILVFVVLSVAAAVE